MQSTGDDYRAQYRDPRWQKLRLKVFERDGFVCKECGRDDQQLHAHHKRYIRGWKVWEYPVWMLVTLCDDCHAGAHDGQGLWFEVVADQLLQLAPDGDCLGHLSYALSLAESVDDGDWIGPAGLSYIEWGVLAQAVEGAMKEIAEMRAKRAA